MGVPPARLARHGTRHDPAPPGEERAPAPPAPDLPRNHPLLALQRTTGNAAVARLMGAPAGGVLQRDPDPAVDVAPPLPVPAAGAIPADLAAFMSMSYIFKDVKPTTGGGLFDMAYEPTTGEMIVTVKVCFDFTNGNIFDPAWLAAIGGLAEVFRRGYTWQDFIWTKDEETAWAANAIAEIQDIWSEKYVFFSQTPGWESLPPVNVKVVVAEAPKTGTGKAQWVVAVNKWPDDAGLTESMSWPHVRGDQNKGRLHESSRDAGGIGDPDSVHRTRTTGSRARYGQVDTDNPGTISFPKAGHTLAPADAARLETFGQTLGAPDIPPFPVTVTGHASAEGEEEKNLTLSRKRADAVADAIMKGKPHKTPDVKAEGEAGAAPDDPAWRVAKITVGAFEATRTVVVHEFGHMLGLDDEYPTADPATPGGPATERPVGTPTGHSALAERLIPGQQPILAHHDESIMSNGDQVRPYHYVTFLEALGTITGTTGTWGIRPAPPKALGPGDFPLPVPTPDGSVPV
ncbi:MAG: OmpA family protein [Thermoleophilia bacterium]